MDGLLVHVRFVLHLCSHHLPGLVDAAQTLLGGLQQLRRQLLQALGVANLQVRPENDEDMSVKKRNTVLSFGFKFQYILLSKIAQ